MAAGPMLFNSHVKDCEAQNTSRPVECEAEGVTGLVEPLPSPLAGAVILVIDNQDSFTYNLVQALQRLGCEAKVLEAKRTSLRDVCALNPSGILIGPGPGRPEDAALSLELVTKIRDRPILGVCLGQQAIAQAFGAQCVRSKFLCHGRTTRVQHDGRGVFAGLSNPSEFTRYNSLCVEERSLPACIEVSARSPEGEVMGLRHHTRALEGVQFHPESVLSSEGLALLGNFVSLATGQPTGAHQTGQGPSGIRRSSPS